MAFSTETVGRVWASARNYSQYAIGFATSIGVMSAGNSKGLMAGISDVYEGVSQMVQGLTSIWQILLVIGGPVVSVVIARFASNSASVVSQVAAVKAAVLDPNTPITAETKRDIVSTAKAA